MEYVIKLPDGYAGADDQTRWFNPENAERFADRLAARNEAYLRQCRRGLAADEVIVRALQTAILLLQ
jgi:hypothetical protein